MIKQNLHTHSVYCDGKDTIDEMAKTAIDKGFTILGYSGHGPCRYDTVAMRKEDLPSYLEDISQAKEKYKDQIQIYTGIEEDISDRIPSKDPYDYVIGSKHFMIFEGDQSIEIDFSPERWQKIVSMFDGDFFAFAKAYYEDIKKMAGYKEVDIVGHLDLLMKFNEGERFASFNDPAYLAYAKDCIDALVDANKIFEVNTGAISRGYRKDPYPHVSLLKYIYERNGKILLNSDCHNRFDLDCHYPESMDLIKECGFSTMMVLTENGFKEVPIDQFQV